MNLTTTIAWMTTAAAVMLSSGCANREQDKAANAEFKKKHDSTAANADFFKPQGEERVSPFINVQASNGARHDAMLYPHHFTAGHLNSLGRSKVLLMLENCESCEPTTVYMVDCGEGELLAQRKAAVELYLKTAEGINPDATTPAAPHMARLAKTENGEVTVETIKSDALPMLTGGPMSDAAK